MAQTWIINEQINPSPFNFSVNFISNSLIYTKMEQIGGALYYDNDHVAQINYNTGVWKWTDQAYRTVTFETSPTGDLLTWLQANAIKQSSTNKFTKLKFNGLFAHKANGEYIKDLIYADNTVSIQKPNDGGTVKWDPAEIELNGNILSTPVVEGVTMYKIYSNGNYIGYVDGDNIWHGEVE